MERKKFNKGEIANGVYTKRISINKAVLWMTREISLNTKIVKALQEHDVKSIKFIDASKKEKWEMSMARFMQYAEVKQVGQEPQYYIGIDLFAKTKL